jgi:nucleoside-diphosphate-sugar epimerase
MHILLTGATGFLGSSLLPLLVEKRMNVFCLGKRAPFLKQENIHWVESDLSSSLDRSKLPGRIDAVIHLAQSHDYRHFPELANAIFDINIGGTQRLLDLAYRLQAGYFLFTSTGSVYENITGVCDEEMALKPSSYYANSKYCAEKLITAYNSCYPTAILRLFNLYGPKQTDKLIPHVIQSIMEGRPITLRGSGTGPFLKPTFVEDIAYLILSALEHKWAGLYNVASQEGIYLKDLASMIGGLLGKEPTFQIDNHPYLSLNPSLARLESIYDLRLFTPLSEGIEKTLRA